MIAVLASRANMQRKIDLGIGGFDQWGIQL